VNREILCTEARFVSDSGVATYATRAASFDLNQSFTVSGSAFGTDTITVNNRSINMFTAALNYKFGGWGY
jgi:hypothetical protein